MTQDSPAAIVLSGYVVGMGPIRSLGERGVRVVLGATDPADPTRASRYLSEVLALPDPEVDEEAFVVALLAAGERYPGAIVFPAGDDTLKAASRNRERLAERFRVACDGWDAVRMFLDKQYTYSLAESAGVPVPRTAVPTSLEDVEHYADRVDYPVLVKPSLSHLYFERFRRKLTQVENADELRAAYTEAAEAGLEVVLQEMIPGDDALGTYYNCYMVDGESVAEFTARKVRLQPSPYGRASSMVSRWVPELAEPGRAVLRAAGYTGFACIEFKQDPRDGMHKLMEVNARINMSSLLAVRSGIDFAWLIYRHLAFGELPAPMRQATGVYWIDGGRDLFAGARDLAGGRTSLRALVAPYARRHVWAMFDRRDPRPAITRYLGFGRAAARRLVGRLVPRRSGAAKP